MVRFLHTADWQIGMKAAHAGEKAKAVRQKRFETAGRIVELAKEKDVDFVLLAGDTFEHHNVDNAAVKRTVDILNRFDPIPVYVLPGNHDPMVPGGVWDRDAWERIGLHVTLLGERQEYCCRDDVVLYACPLTQKQSGLDPTAWIPNREDGDSRIRIGVAHGSLNILPGTVNFPIAGDRPEQSGLDYLALGDWHGHRIFGRAVYPGTMEPTSFSEQGSGSVLVVEIDEAGAEPRIEACRVNALTWAELIPPISTTDDVEMLDAAIQSFGSLASLLLKVSPDLGGCTDSKALERLETLQEELRESAFFLEWTDPVRQPVVGERPAQIPDGVLCQVDETLATVLDGRIPEGPGHQFADRDPEVVLAARMLLHRLAGGRSA
ncbi:MAG: Metallophosphoesterase [Methanoculleus marisnigri]|jgi:DNA repair exonuclease|uniref:Metallophosphoesterase n=1 Tax=Methanoculleus marisnigri TaxID=2198 RepID=A0A117MFI6_9EURY|nr:DNA repair exonuclease [Methanoculleus marisnigri]KUK62201.1 MAG: Metallophosphoesterase [Methanoculleus marisnigri]KUL01288.1 MAG: Metallophosphoesterase [Methanoculleus marisnigri]